MILSTNQRQRRENMNTFCRWTGGRLTGININGWWIIWGRRRCRTLTDGI
nr:MAG TPA: hypothetical protein [Caudoviricetes sp.]